MNNKILTLLLTAVCFGLFSASAIFGQATDNGGLQGTVFDSVGAVVPNVRIKAENISTGQSRTTVSNGQGEWKIAVLPPGDYEITAEADGFAPATQTARVEVSVSTSVRLELGVASLEGEVVDVAVNDGEQVIAGGNSPMTSSVFTGRVLEAAPLPVRSALARTALDTSTSGNLADPLTNGNGNPESSVNGTRTNSSSYIFDGIDATNVSGTGSLTENAAPAPEVVEEVKLLSSLYDASLGRSGGGSFQVVTRRGGNSFNGTAYFYAQNEQFNANDFFYNRDGIDRQVARRLEGGATIGGPIIKNKLFFFAGYQRTDAKTAYVPSAQSFVILPEALAFITDRSDPENVRQAFLRSVNNGGVGRVFRNGSGCIRNLTLQTSPSLTALTCIDPSSVGFRLLNLRNPATGGFIIPSLTQGRFERLYQDSQNVGVFVNGVRTTNFSAFGFPNGLPLLDATFQGQIGGGLPLVRFRNVFPAEFEQDQITTRLDYNLYDGGSDGLNSNTLSGSFFFSDFPSLDPFSDDTLVSPTPLIKDDRNRTLSIKDVHVFSGNLINEARFGFFFLDNSRRLDDRFLIDELTNEGQGIYNPATAFVSGAPTQRLARFAGTGNLSDFSVNAPNDIFNKRKQVTLTFANNVTYITGNHSLRFGVEHKRNFFDTSLPEEQGIEFEGLVNFTQLLTTFVPEADVSLGITDKQFRFNDLSFYVSDDWQVRSNLTFNIGLRWDLFGLPFEKNGRFANFDFDRVTDPNNILPGIVLPSNAQKTGFPAIDGSLDSLARADTKHTLNGQDLNNFAPRVGFAFKPFDNEKTVIRGGYGIFYDRPSAGFINTVYSNYPYFGEVEVSNSFRPNAVQGSTAFLGIDPTRPFVQRFPYFTQLTSQSDVSPYILLNNGQGVNAGNGAEPLEFRAIDKDLKTPMIQQWNIGIQQEISKNWTIEARYVGTRGQNLLLAVGFNQPYDLNDPNTPDYIYERLNNALTAQFPGRLPARIPGQTARDRGTTTANNSPRAFGACNPAFAGVAGYAPCSGVNGAGGIDLNLTSFDFENPRAIIDANVRVPFLGLDPTDAIILQSRGYSIYHSGQFNISRRFADGFNFNASYTFSKSIDIGSTDPGSTTASGRPDTANLGLVVQGDQRNLNSNRAVSDFDRPHRFSSSFVYEIPNFGSKSKFLNGFQISGFGQWQSGTPFSIFATDADFFPQTAGGAFLRQYFGIVALVTERNTPLGGTFREENYNVGAGSGTIFNTAFGRPSVRNLDLLKRRGDDITRQYFNTCQNPNDADCALIAPLGGFGNLGRNVLRGPSGKRFDLSLQKTTRISERVSLELKWDIFNVFNFVNFANPNSDLNDETDFGQITRTVGAPRVMQFGAKLRF